MFNEKKSKYKKQTNAVLLDKLLFSMWYLIVLTEQLSREQDVI